MSWSPARELPPMSVTVGAAVLMDKAMYRSEEKGIAKMVKNLTRAERKAARLKLFNELLDTLEDVYYHWPLATYYYSRELRWAWNEQDKEKIKLLIDRAREVGCEPQMPTV